jgi:hypothetical protein
MLLDIILCVICEFRQSSLIIAHVILVCACINRARTGIAHLDRILERLVLFFWSTALPPALVMIPAVVLYHVNSSRLNGSWCAVCLATSAKLYCHSLLRTLNSRDRLRDRLRKNSFSEFHTDVLQDHIQGIGRTDPALVSTEVNMSTKQSPWRPSFVSDTPTRISQSVRPELHTLEYQRLNPIQRSLFITDRRSGMGPPPHRWVIQS